MSAPVTKKVEFIREHHGDRFVDEYEWLRDKESPEVIAALEAENAYTEAHTAHLAPLREELFNEIKTRTQETDLSVPSRRGSWWYYSRSFEGKQYGVHCRCPILDADDWTPPTLSADVAIDGEQILLDSNVEADGHEFFSLGAFSVSHDGTLLAYSADTVGDERYTLRVKDLTTGELLPDVIANIAHGATWSPDGRHLFYQTVDDSWRPDTVWRHVLGTAGGPESDVQVFHEPDDRYWVGIGQSRSERYLMIGVGSKVTSETLVLNAQNPEGEFVSVLGRHEGIEYAIEHVVVGGEDRFLVLHNRNAVNFELAELPADRRDASFDELAVLVPHRDDVRLEDVDTFAQHMVLSYRREAISRLQVWPLASGTYGEPWEISFDEELFAAGLGGNPEWAAPRLRVGYTSFVTPTRLYDVDLADGSLTLLKEQPVLGDFHREDYVQQRDWALADDGTRVPVSIVRRKDVTGPAPTLLYGYGSYESSIDPHFSIARLSLLDRGMVFVVAHVRGGGELGRLWYDNGKTLTKKNTFTDFVAVARHIVNTGVTTPRQLVAEGGSAGGLLVGAAVNLAPELFAGVLAVVPFVDPLTSILDPSLPLTVIEWDEWGNPLADKDVYEYMRSYSPYENVRAVDYPAILAITSLNDTRVLYTEPAKWVARLREVSTGSAPILLKTEMSAGHGGVSGRYEKWREVAFEHAWVLAISGAVQVR